MPQCALGNSLGRRFGQYEEEQTLPFPKKSAYSGSEHGSCELSGL